MIDLFRLFAPWFFSISSAVAIDQWAVSRRLNPPAFENPWRRFVAATTLALVLYAMVFKSLGEIGLPVAEVDLSQIPYFALFLGHAMLILALGVWFLLGFFDAVGDERSLPSVAAEQLGVRCQNLLKEVAIGLGLGLLIWPMLLLVVGTAALILFSLGRPDLLPQQPPEMIVWVAGLPVAVKLAIALSAGVVEELFFRGFLQPRIGIVLSTVFFALAHLAYDEPFMLIGITFLSLAFAALVRWRQNIWAAVAAHFLFDAVQLLIIIPWGLGELDKADGLLSWVAVFLGRTSLG